MTARRAWDVIVVGAGVFGVWTAWRLLNQGKRVLLVDAWGPGHARASSGDESRMTRTAYGPAARYSCWAWEALDDWRWLSAKADLPLFHQAGALFFAGANEPYVEQSIEVHRRLSIPLELMDPADLRRRWPQVDWTGVETAIHEPHSGPLMARRAVQTLTQLIVQGGGEYLQVQVAPPDPDAAVLETVTASAGERLSADSFVFACGAWLPKVFPDLLENRIFPTRQEVFYFATPPGDGRFHPREFPAWAELIDGELVYGFPNLEERGFKMALDLHGPRFDPDLGDRLPTEAGMAAARAYLARRFPLLAKAPLNEARVCQYENTSNGDFLIDRHPRWANVVLLGGGSGHGFKHGPVVGSEAAALLLDPARATDRELTLAAKGTVQTRAVH